MKKQQQDEYEANKTYSITIIAKNSINIGRFIQASFGCQISRDKLLYLDTQSKNHERQSSLPRQWRWVSVSCLINCNVIYKNTEIMKI